MSTFDPLCCRLGGGGHANVRFSDMPTAICVPTPHRLQLASPGPAAESGRQSLAMSLDTAATACNVFDWKQKFNTLPTPLCMGLVLTIPQWSFVQVRLFFLLFFALSALVWVDAWVWVPVWVWAWVWVCRCSLAHVRVGGYHHSLVGEGPTTAPPPTPSFFFRGANFLVKTWWVGGCSRPSHTA